MMNQVIAHPLYSINSTEIDGDIVYDWSTNTGDASDEWFETAADAEREVRDILGVSADIVVLTRAEHDELLDYKWRYEELTK